jgi:hypothetical protein
MLEQQVSRCQLLVDQQQLQQLPVQLRINIMPPALHNDQAGIQVSSSMQAQPWQQAQHLEQMQHWVMPGTQASNPQQLLPHCQVTSPHESVSWGGPGLHQQHQEGKRASWPSDLQQQQAAEQQQNMLHHAAQQEPFGFANVQPMCQQQQQQQLLQQQKSGQPLEQQSPEGVYVTPAHTSQQRAHSQGTPPAAVPMGVTPGSAPEYYSGTPPVATSPLSAPPAGMYNWPAGFFSPASCWSIPTVEQFAAMSAAAAAHSTVSCSSGNMGMFNVARKYKRAKALLQVCTVQLFNRLALSRPKCSMPDTVSGN